MNKKKLIADLMLTVTAIIWGSAFVAQVKGMEYIGPFTFVAVRNFIAPLFLIPVIYIMGKLNKKNQDATESETGTVKIPTKKDYIIGGLCCGTALFIGSALQQIGLLYTSAGKAGFITTLYIVIVPLFGLFLHKKVGKLTWIGVALSTIGLYLLCVKEGFSIHFGDLIVFIGAFFWSSHILLIDHFSPKMDGVKLSCMQFIFCGLISVVPALIWEQPTMSAILASAIPILYAGILSSGVAYTLQIVAQKNTDPTIASLIMSTEAVFAAIAGFFILGQVLSLREMIGCSIMFAAVIIAQLPEKKVLEPEPEQQLESNLQS